LPGGLVVFMRINSERKLVISASMLFRIGMGMFYWCTAMF